MNDKATATSPTAPAIDASDRRCSNRAFLVVAILLR
jgi:hypothetical protein